MVSPDMPGHRNVDTSLAAADATAYKLGRLQGMAHAGICAAEAEGLTCDELAARRGTDRWAVRPRISELRCKKLIHDSGKPRPNCSGKLALVWIAT